MYRKLISSLIAILAVVTSLYGQINTDSLQISLLTATPGEEVYARFGHTALRVKDLKGDSDLVFNYGLFSFNSPNFLYRFVKGETDYQLGVSEMPYFVTEYAMRGSQVYEQVINLSPAESKAVFEALKRNYLPQNRVYRYNFFYDNCSTRPRDIIEKNISGKISYQPIPASEGTTYRELVHRKTDIDPWLAFGIDLTLGAKADAKVDNRQKMFLPELLMESFGHASVRKDSITVPLVSETNKLVTETGEPDEVESNNPLMSPIFVCWSLLLLVILLETEEIRQQRVFAMLDTVIFSLVAVAGSILFFLNFCSTHPTVDDNFNCIWLQPLALFAAMAVWVNSLKRVLYYYHFINFVVLSLLILLYGIIPQQFNPAFFPLIGIILTRSAIHIYFKPKKRY